MAKDECNDPEKGKQKRTRILPHTLVLPVYIHVIGYSLGCDSGVGLALPACRVVASDHRLIVTDYFWHSSSELTKAHMFAEIKTIDEIHIRLPGPITVSHDSFVYLFLSKAWWLTVAETR